MGEEFVWGCRPNIIQSVIARRPPDKGGIGLIDLEIQIKATRIMWLKRVFDTMEHPYAWKILPGEHLTALYTKFRSLSVPIAFAERKYYAIFWENICADFTSIEGSFVQNNVIPSNLQVYRLEIAAWRPKLIRKSKMELL